MNATRAALFTRVWADLGKIRHRLTQGVQSGLPTLAALNLSIPQVMALFRIAEGGPKTISELQVATGRSQAATSHLVAQLERKKLVQRADDADDARRTRVRLTPKSEALIRQVEGLRVRSFEQAFAQVPTADLSRLDEALTAVVAALEKPR